MTVHQQHITDPASIERQGLLLAAFEASSADWQDKADTYRQAGMREHMEAALTAAYDAHQTAAMIRRRLVAAAALAETSTPELADVLARLPFAGSYQPGDLTTRTTSWRPSLRGLFQHLLAFRLGGSVPWLF